MERRFLPYTFIRRASNVAQLSVGLLDHLPFVHLDHTSASIIDREMNILAHSFLQSRYALKSPSAAIFDIRKRAY